MTDRDLGVSDAVGDSVLSSEKKETESIPRRPVGARRLAATRTMSRTAGSGNASRNVASIADSPTWRATVARLRTAVRIDAKT